MSEYHGVIDEKRFPPRPGVPQLRMGNKEVDPERPGAKPLNAFIHREG